MPSREHKVAVLYVRVSTDEQDVNNQLPDIQAYCQRQGYTIGKVYEEAGRQGDDANRPAWTALRKAAFGYRPGFDAVVAFDATRYSRDLIPFLLDVREFANHGIRLETVREGHLELDSEAGLVLTAVQGAFAQNEKRRIKARVQASVKAAKARGAQFGRKRAFDPELFIRLRSEGLSQRKRARRLGLSQPQVHHHDRVLDVLHTLPRWPNLPALERGKYQLDRPTGTIELKGPSLPSGLTVGVGPITAYRKVETTGGAA